MATTTDNPRGYRCDFVNVVPEDFYCKKCSLVAKMLTICSHCMESYCHECINVTKEQGLPCPTCSKEDFLVLPQVKYRKRIYELQVYCNLKERGCGWSGTLDMLDTHLDPDQDNCKYVDTKCPLNCGQTVPKNKMDQHVSEECVKRDHFCQYCSFKATYEEVVDKHLPECKQVLIPCPNECGVTTERDFLQDHKKTCPLEEIECEFSVVGCEERFRRKDQEEHVTQNSHKHLTLTATLAKELQQKLNEQGRKHREEEDMLKMKVRVQDETTKEQEKNTKEQECTLKKKLEQQRDKYEKKLAEQQKKIEEHEEKIGKQEMKLMEQEATLETQKKKINEVNKAIADLQKAWKDQQEPKLKDKDSPGKTFSQTLKQLEEKFKGQIAKTDSRDDADVIREVEIQQRTFEVKNYSTEIKSECTSPTMYTHLYGYKFYARFYISARNYLCVSLFSMPGEYDYHLQWPAKAKFTIEILNPVGGKNAVYVSEMWTWDKPVKESKITTTGLSLLDTSRIQNFLANDKLRFSVSNIKLL